jgi:hypothetical protein
MDENGIMHSIRDLFSQGFNAAEIIAEGYAPSTVYRVQRGTRRKSGLNGNSGYCKGSTSYGPEHLGHLEADNQRLRLRLDAMEKQLAAIAEQETLVPCGNVWKRSSVR